jgi:hypothetical protein
MKKIATILFLMASIFAYGQPGVSIPGVQLPRYSVPKLTYRWYNNAMHLLLDKDSANLLYIKNISVAQGVTLGGTANNPIIGLGNINPASVGTAGIGVFTGGVTVNGTGTGVTVQGASGSNNTFLSNNGLKVITATGYTSLEQNKLNFRDNGAFFQELRPNPNLAGSSQLALPNSIGGDTLISQKTIKTINSAPITGIGNINLQTPLAAGTDYLIPTGSAAGLTGLASVAKSGAYSDLSGKPTAVSSFTNDAGYLTNVKTINSSSITGSGNINLQTPLSAGTDYLTPSGSAAGLTGFPILNQNTTGNAATATRLATARTINGVSFDGSADITLPTSTGTVTSVATGYGLTGGTITTSGTLLVDTTNSSGLISKGRLATNLTGYGKLTANSNVFTGTLTAKNNYSTSSSPSIVAGAASGSSPSVGISGSNQDGSIEIMTGTSPSIGTICTITMSGGFAYPVTTTPVITAVGSTTILKTANIGIGSTSTTTFTLYTTVALAANTTYQWNYHNGGY